MKNLAYFLWCTVFILFGYVVTLKLSPLEIKAEMPNRIPELTIPKINPVGQLDLLIDLETGKTKISSTLDCVANVTVNKPAEMLSKPTIKKQIEYVTKTEYLMKTAIFSLPAAKLHISKPQIPHKVEK